MTFLFGFWLALGVAVLGVWFVRLVTVGAAFSARRILSESADAGAPLANAPRISVIVAARDEQDHIETCLRSLLNQDYPQFDVIAVDDRSRDNSPAILQRLGDEFPDRLQTVTIRTLEEGWFGKCHAMREGVARSRGDWLLLTDADCRFTSRQAISRAIEEARAQEVDFLTIIPQLDAPTVWERVLQPICALVLMFWFQPKRVNNPAYPTAYANGAFMLLTRRCYDGIGGHSAVRNALNEDIQLARRTKAQGWRLCVVENDGLYRTRMYPTFGAAWRGWSRIFCGALQTPWRAGLAAVMVMVFAVLPSLGTITAALGFLTATSATAPTWAFALTVWSLAFLVEHLVVWRLYGALKVGRGWSLLYLLAGLFMVGILVNAFLKTLGATSTTWRGMTYRGRRTLLVSAPNGPVQEQSLPAVSDPVVPLSD